MRWCDRWARVRCDGAMVRCDGAIGGARATPLELPL